MDRGMVVGALLIALIAGYSFIVIRKKVRDFRAGKLGCCGSSCNSCAAGCSGCKMPCGKEVNGHE